MTRRFSDFRIELLKDIVYRTHMTHPCWVHRASESIRPMTEIKLQPKISQYKNAIYFIRHFIRHSYLTLQLMTIPNVKINGGIVKIILKRDSERPSRGVGMRRSNLTLINPYTIMHLWVVIKLEITSSHSITTKIITYLILVKYHVMKSRL